MQSKKKQARFITYLPIYLLTYLPPCRFLVSPAWLIDMPARRLYTAADAMLCVCYAMLSVPDAMCRAVTCVRACGSCRDRCSGRALHCAGMNGLRDAREVPIPRYLHAAIHGRADRLRCRGMLRHVFVITFFSLSARLAVGWVMVAEWARRWREDCLGVC